MCYQVPIAPSTADPGVTSSITAPGPILHEVISKVILILEVFLSVTCMKYWLTA